MSKGKGILTDAVLDEMHQQLVDMYNKLEPYVDDRELYKTEALVVGSDFDMTSDRQSVMNAWRKNFIQVVPTADAAILSDALDELSATPAQLDPIALENEEGTG